MRSKLILTVFVASAFNMALAQITLPAASPAGKVYSKVGLTDINISYARPKVKDRKIFGEGDSYLVPFGELWRTGANAGTLITIDKDLMVEGTNLPAGEYMILTVPGKDTWDFIFYKDKSLGGNMANHKKEDEQLRVTVKPTKLTEAVESMTFNISDISEDNSKAAIELAWANTSVKVGISTELDKQILSQIEASLKISGRAYATAANYYFSTGKDVDQAIEWINMAIMDNPKDFRSIYNKAKMLAKKGDKKSIKAAIDLANESLVMDKTDESNFWIGQNETLLAELNK